MFINKDSPSRLLFASCINPSLFSPPHCRPRPTFFPTSPPPRCLRNKTNLNSFRPHLSKYDNHPKPVSKAHERTEIESETRGRAAAQRRRDELKCEQEELEKLREEIKKALRTGEVNREVAILGAAEIEGDIRALHRISGRDEKDQWIRLRLERHVEEAFDIVVTGKVAVSAILMHFLLYLKNSQVIPSGTSVQHMVPEQNQSSLV
ncbi:hypothetical protein CFRS1_v015464 [Colletotrichum fructicola]|nr:hypothetical protein CFRS1_v015464 [Colletotrichum fructicola]